MADQSSTPWDEFNTAEVEKMARILDRLYPHPDVAYPATFNLTEITKWVYQSGQRSVVEAIRSELLARRRQVDD